MTGMDERSRRPNDATDPNLDETYPGDDLGGNQQRAYAARQPRAVIRDAHEALERATERHGEPSDAAKE